MIGNIDYIIDELAKEKGYDRRMVEVIAGEVFRSWKYKITNSEKLTIYVPKLGYWTGSNNKLRGYVREYIRKLRKTRHAIASKRLTPEKLERYMQMEQVYVNNIKRAWKQLEAIRALYIKRTARSKIKKLKRECLQ